MTLTEVKADLFQYHDKGYYLVHCISADFKLGAGIAKEFERRYKLREDLLYAFGEKWYLEYDKMFPGTALIHKQKRVIDLVTKTRFWHKPTIYSIGRALQKMKSGLGDIKKIAMPRIGCGLDKLKWEDVRNVIEKVFDDTDIDIVVCYLK